MSFVSENEIEQFSFEDCCISSYKEKDEKIEMELDALIVLPKNSQNANYTASYADTARFILEGGSITAAYLEGHKEYDAYDRLVEEVPDKELGIIERDELLSKIKGAFMFSFEKIEEKDGKSIYEAELEFPTEDGIADPWNSTYLLRFAFDKAIVKWDRYLNRVQR